MLVAFLSADTVFPVLSVLIVIPAAALWLVTRPKRLKERCMLAMALAAFACGFVLFFFATEKKALTATARSLQAFYLAGKMLLADNSMELINDLPEKYLRAAQILIRLCLNAMLIVVASAALSVFGRSVTDRLRLLLPRKATLILVGGGNEALSLGRSAYAQSRPRVVFLVPEEKATISLMDETAESGGIVLKYTKESFSRAVAASLGFFPISRTSQVSIVVFQDCGMMAREAACAALKACQRRGIPFLSDHGKPSYRRPYRFGKRLAAQTRRGMPAVRAQRMQCG